MDGLVNELCPNGLRHIFVMKRKRAKGGFAIALLCLALGIATVWAGEIGYGDGVIVNGGQARAVGVLWILLALTIFYSYFRR